MDVSPLRSDFDIRDNVMVNGDDGLDRGDDVDHGHYDDGEDVDGDGPDRGDGGQHGRL